jgi:hypothetical protein
MTPVMTGSSSHVRRSGKANPSEQAARSRASARMRRASPRYIHGVPRPPPSSGRDRYEAAPPSFSHDETSPTASGPGGADAMLWMKACREHSQILAYAPGAPSIVTS